MGGTRRESRESGAVEQITLAAILLPAFDAIDEAKLVGLEGIEPPPTVPKTVVLSVELQAQRHQVNISRGSREGGFAVAGEDTRRYVDTASATFLR